MLGGTQGAGPHDSLLHALQLEERAACSAELGNSLQSSRREIADLNVRIQKLRSQILSIKSHVSVWRTHPEGGAGRSAALTHMYACSHMRHPRKPWLSDPWAGH